MNTLSLMCSLLCFFFSSVLKKLAFFFFGLGSSLRTFLEHSSAHTGNFSASESNKAKEAPKSIIVEDVPISPHLSKSKGAIQKKQPVLKSLILNLDVQDPKSTVLQDPSGEVSVLFPSRLFKLRDSQNFDNLSTNSQLKQPSSKRIEDTTEKLTIAADS
jgi:hypothetical protein